MTDVYLYRNGCSEDLAYIASSWVKSYAHSQHAKDCAKVYRTEAPVYIDRLIKHPDTVLRVAHLEDDFNALMGWCCYRLSPYAVIHYCYVRDGVRRKKIGTNLLKEILVIPNLQFSHKPIMNFSEKGLRLSSPILPSTWTYNPYEISK